MLSSLAARAPCRQAAGRLRRSNRILILHQTRQENKMGPKGPIFVFLRWSESGADDAMRTSLVPRLAVENRSGHTPRSQFFIQIECSLQVHPQLRRCAQSIRKIKSCCRSYTSLAFNEFIQASCRPANFLGKCRLRHTLWLKKLLE